PFHVEPRNIVKDGPLERVSSEASILNSRVHYYGRLTGSSDRLLSPPDHVIPQPEDIYIYSPLGTAFKVRGAGASKNPSIVTIFAIWNTMMGTSILSIPWGIKQAGFTLGVLIVSTMGLLTLYCCYRVLKSPKSIPYEDTSDWEFPDVCKYYFGKIGQLSSLVFSLVSLIGAMVVYWVLMSNFLYNTGKFIYNYEHNISDPDFGSNESVICPYQSHHNNITVGVGISSSNDTSDALFNVWWSKTNTIPFYLIILLLPLLNFRSASFFARFTFLEFRTLFPQLTGVLTLAFFIHNCIITLMKNNRHQENNVRDLSVAYLLVGLTYLYVGVLIFAAFPSPPFSKKCIEPNFLDNFPSSDVLVFIARACLLFQMTSVYPLLGYLARVQIMGYLFGSHYPSFFHVITLNVLIVAAGVLMAKFYPDIGSIIRQGALRWPSALFHSLLIVLGIANLLGQFFM
ncbi:hypothetical protein CRUP_021780, partial [Coryphaenoides rupestris]